jgi:hypothetical protein
MGVEPVYIGLPLPENADFLLHPLKMAPDAKTKLRQVKNNMGVSLGAALTALRAPEKSCGFMVRTALLITQHNNTIERAR